MVEMLDKMRMDSAQKNKRGIAFKREINVFPFRVTRHILQCSGSQERLKVTLVTVTSKVKCYIDTARSNKEQEKKGDIK